MDMQLKDKRALVTDSTSDIGAGIAQRLAAEGVAGYPRLRRRTC
jgi:NAD(P)-dependent dehydrogenase (short-subunit alcohol dehydrogenase family)